MLPPRKVSTPLAENFELRRQCLATMQTFGESYLVSCGNWENSFQIISLNDGRIMRNIRQHKDVVSCVAVPCALGGTKFTLNPPPSSRRIFIGVIGLYLQTWGIDKKGPALAANFTPLSLMITIVLSTLLLRETTNLKSILGGDLMVIGLYGALCGKIKESNVASDYENLAQE